LLFRYGLSVATTAGATGLRLALTAWIGPGFPPFITFYPAVMLVALLAGFGPGLLATALTASIAGIWYLQPVGRLALESGVDRVALLVFVGMGIAMSVTSELHRRDREKAAAFDREASARENLARLATFAESTFEGIVESEHGRIVDCNERFSRMLGYSLEELRGMEMADLILAEDVERVIGNIRSNVESSNELRVHRKDGALIVVEAHGRQVFPGSSRRHTAVRDITGQKRVEGALREAQGALEGKVAERTAELAASLARLQDEIALRQKSEDGWRASEERLRLSIEATGLGTFELIPATGGLACSDLTRKHFGMPPETPVDYGVFLRAIHPDDRDRVAEGIRSSLLPGSDGEFRDVFRPFAIANPHERHLSIFGRACTDPGGRTTRIIGILRDITERRQAADMILRLNRLYAVLSATNQAIAHKRDRDSIFREFCRVSVEKGGFRLAWVGLVDKASGLVHIVASHGEIAYLEGIRISSREEPEGMGPTGRCIREGSIVICNDFHASDSTGPWKERARRHEINASASIALKRNDEVIGAFTLYAGEKDFFDSHQVELLRQMALDVSFALENIEKESRRRETERALLKETAEKLRVIEELREKDRLFLQQSRLAAMGEMIGNIAHQWRQPLNGVALHVQLLREIHDNGSLSREVLHGNVERIMTLVRHMSQTIDDFRNFFSPGKEKTEFNVHEVASRTFSLIGDSFRNNRIAIDVDRRDDPVLYGYPNEYSQALLNILINARDALTERSIPDPRIRLTILSEGGKGVVLVSDNAGGIPEAILDRIFEPYFTTKGQIRGTGVGLFISKTIIEKNMNGRLTARNVGDGAEFRIEV
jgi:PAS domain S-box-containing protein